MKKIGFTLLMLLAFAGAVFAQSDLQVLTVVKYNKSESITVKLLKSRCEVYEKQIGRKLSEAERKSVLKALVDEKLVLQAAAKSGINIPDSTVDQYFLQAMCSQIGVNVSEKELYELVKQTQGVTLDQLLKQQVGMNVAEYKAYLKNQLIAQQYVVSQKQQEIMQQAATDEEIRAFYQSNKASFVWTDMAKIFLVIVPKDKNPDDSRSKITDLRNKYVGKKISAEQMAVQSKMENSGYQAGEMLLPITEAGANGIGITYQSLLSMIEKGEGYVCDVQETPLAFMFFGTVKKYDAKMLAISDILQPDSTVTVYEYIRENITQQKQMQYLQIAAQEISDSLNKPEYVEEKKTGAALDKLLAWGE